MRGQSPRATQLSRRPNQRTAWFKGVTIVRGFFFTMPCYTVAGKMYIYQHIYRSRSESGPTPGDSSPVLGPYPAVDATSARNQVMYSSDIGTSRAPPQLTSVASCIGAFAECPLVGGSRGALKGSRQNEPRRLWHRDLCIPCPCCGYTGILCLPAQPEPCAKVKKLIAKPSTCAWNNRASVLLACTLSILFSIDNASQLGSHAPPVHKTIQQKTIINSLISDL
jgi:hypothetical protein